MGVSKTSDHFQIKIRMPNPSEEPPASSKAPNEDLKDMDVLCTFKIKIEGQNSDNGSVKDHWSFPNQDQDIKPQSGTPASLKSIWEDKIKHQWPYPNQDQDAKPQSGTSSVLQSPKWGLKGHGCSLHLQNQDRVPKFRTWIYKRPMTIFKSRSRCQTPVMNLQHPPKPQMMT